MFLNENVSLRISLLCQSEEFRSALYDCEWYSAPMPFQKLILNLLTRTMQIEHFEAQPLYQLNLDLLGRVSVGIRRRVLLLINSFPGSEDQLHDYRFSKEFNIKCFSFIHSNPPDSILWSSRMCAYLSS